MIFPSALKAGGNVLAIEVLRYSDPHDTSTSQTPMSAVVYLEAEDGSVDLFKTGGWGWRGALNARGDWHAASFDDSSWKEAIRYVPPAGGSDDGDLGSPWPTGPVKSLRRNFEVRKAHSSARVYATALGAYKLSINGRSVGDDVLAPGWTDFRERAIYQTYDVTEDLQSGKNTIAALLAPGWYSTPLEWFQQGYNYGQTPPALRAQLRIEYKDGSIDSDCDRRAVESGGLADSQRRNLQRRNLRRSQTNSELGLRDLRRQAMESGGSRSSA